MIAQYFFTLKINDLTQEFNKCLNIHSTKTSFTLILSLKGMLAGAIQSLCPDLQLHSSDSIQFRETLLSNKLNKAKMPTFL